MMRRRLAHLVVSSGLAFGGCAGEDACTFRIIDTSGRGCIGTLCPGFEMSCAPAPAPSCGDGHAWALGPPPGDAGTSNLAICAICLAPDGGIGSEGYFDCHDVVCANDDECRFPVGYGCSNGRCVLP
jgi:hypothetical protein